MKTIIRIVNIFIICFCCCCYAGRPASVSDTSGSLSPMLKTTMPGVVNIAVRGELPLPSLPFLDKQHRQLNIPPKFEDLGSGVIIDAENGYILTNAHVIKDSQIITVTLDDGRKLKARIVGFDTRSDIAVLQIKAKHLTAIKMGDSDKVNIGDFVCAIGSPFGLQSTVTSGVVSSLGRDIEGYENYIQTDAPINPGNSGGALLNMSGHLIGINTAIITPNTIGGNVGIGLAIPSNMAKSVMEQLIKYGKVKRGMMGVMVQTLTPALADAMKLSFVDGVLISQIIKGSPAEKAGLKVKDVILKIMGKPLHTASKVGITISLLPIGSKVQMDILRDKKPLSITAVTIDPEELQAQRLADSKSLLNGLQLKNFNQLIDNESIKGVEVLYVLDTSNAYSSGLRSGDVILSAANKPITTVDELQKAASENPSQMIIEVKRGMSGNTFLVLE